MTGDNNAGLRILHVEDNIGDVRLIAEALKEGGHKHEIAVVSDGVQALEYLYKRGCYSQAPTPDVILLDLNLPRKGGLEVLGEIKTIPEVQNIPVVVFTSSSAPLDINRAYRSHAGCYVTKPADLDELFRVVSAIEKFWLNIAKLPPVQR
jgi:chemotaxis family two-component system response regulator Rcp1